MRPLTIVLVTLVCLASVASCEDQKKEPAVEVPGGGPKGAPQAPPSAAVPGDPAGDPTAIVEDEAEAQCTDWCTLVAGCWEKVNEGEYNQGGKCEAACAGRPAEERRAFGACVMQKTADCKAMLDC